MLRRAETLLDPTARQPEAPPVRGLSPFYHHYLRQERWLIIGLFLFGGLAGILDVTVPAFIGRIVGLVSNHTPQAMLHEAWPQLIGMAVVLLLLRPAVLLCHIVLINQIVNPGLSNMIRWQNHWHVVRQSWTFFQNDFAGRIANRVHADRAGTARERGAVVRRRLVHPCLRQQRAAAARLDRLAPDAADPAVVRLLRRHPVLLRAAPARALPIGLRNALAADRTHRRQLHQHPHGQAVLPRARRGRVRARGDRPAHQRVPRSDPDDHRLCRDAGADERVADRRHREPRDLAVERRPHLGGLGRDGAAADLADHQHGRLGGAQRHVDLREHRHRAGRHEVDRGRAADARSAGCARTARDARRDPLREPALRLWPAAAAGSRRGAARHRPAHRPRRARRAGRPFRRRQIDAGESACCISTTRSAAAS